MRELILLFTCAFVIHVKAQTLYVPGGAAGIGNLTPLRIYPSSNAGSNGALKLQFVSQTGGSIIQANSDFFWTDHDILINAANAQGGNTNQLVLYRDGNVGIGTPSPWEKLHVNGTMGIGTWNAGAQSGLQIQYTEAGGSGASTFKHSRWSGGFYFKRNDAAGERTQLYFGGAGNHYMDIYNNNNEVKIRFNTGGDSYFQGGNVGIGTASPEDQLEIVNGNRKVGFNTVIPNVNNNGNISNGGVLSFSRPGDGMKTMYLGTTASPADDNVIFSNGGGTELRLVSSGGPYPTAGFGFYNNISVQSAFGGERPTNPVMKIDGNGNVGIGTALPDQKLTVKGIIHTNEVRVDLNTPIQQGPDYVFEKNYDLLSLTDLETYINQNKHLPEVPSAKEMEQDGLNLKEMNLILLKKVEELTLHLIEKDKQINTMEKRIEQLEKN